MERFGSNNVFYITPWRSITTKHTQKIRITINAKKYLVNRNVFLDICAVNKFLLFREIIIRTYDKNQIYLFYIQVI